MEHQTALVSIDFDITLVIQFFNYVIALFLINYFILKPVRGYMAQRRIMMNNMDGEAKNFESETAKRLKQYEADIEAAKTQASAQKEALRKQAAEKEQALLGEAQKEAQLLLKQAREKIMSEVAAARTELQASVPEMAGQVVVKVLG